MARVQHKIVVDDAHLEGVFSDNAMIWHNETTFVLDFIADISPIQPTGPEPERNSKLVSRVRIPVGLALKLAKIIGDELDRYEQDFGELPATIPPDTPPKEDPPNESTGK